MKIYLVERAEAKWDYDQYDSFVCYANTEDEARYTSPSERKDRHDWPDDPKTFKVTELNPAHAFKPEVILASYNAG